jgi:RNA recognition motif-containing protein
MQGYNKERCYSLFIGGLNAEDSVDSKKKCLKDIFSRYGTIERINVKEVFAFVDFKSEEDRNAALTENGTEVLGRRIRVSEGKGKKDGNKILTSRLL